MKYTCEYCNNTYKTEPEAAICEKACREAAERKVKFAKEKEADFNAIKKSIEDFENKYYSKVYSLDADSIFNFFGSI